MAQGVALLIALWLMGLGVFMSARPQRALAALTAMGSTPAIHFVEMGLRTMAGVALVLAAEESRSPMTMQVIGGFLVVSALILAVLPRRWHSAYSNWWAARIPVRAVRLIGPVSMLGGALLIWTTFPG